MPHGCEFEEWSGATVVERIGELAEIYREIYAEPPYLSAALWDLGAFVDRTRRQAARAGFKFVAAHDGDAVVGYSFGFPFVEGQWWSGKPTDPPADILAAAKFAVIELVVLQKWRRVGIGRELLNLLLTDRPEPYAVLTASPDAPARQMYQRWGWRQVGTVKHTPESPTLDALILPLTKAVGRQ